tara:strand:+ start:120070 stop:120240 length:171 start_codon:yes stop_codon:yes gene_type:complete
MTWPKGCFVAVLGVKRWQIIALLPCKCLIVIGLANWIRLSPIKTGEIAKKIDDGFL